jgi:hypothetical protein
MKSRIVLVLTLSALFNPASVFAKETKDMEKLDSKIGCNLSAAKELKRLHSDIDTSELKKIIVKDPKALIDESRKASNAT